MITGPLRSVNMPMPARITFFFELAGAHAREIRGATLLSSWK